jgi:hypothetical protein
MVKPRLRRLTLEPGEKRVIEGLFDVNGQPVVLRLSVKDCPTARLRSSSPRHTGSRLAIAAKAKGRR